MGIWRFLGGKVWSNGDLVQNNSIEVNMVDEDDKNIYLPETSIVLPGLVDFHCHMWAPRAPIGITDREYLSSGVVACADAGTFGYERWEAANQYWQSSRLTVRSWLSVLPEGLTIHPNYSPTPPDNISLERILEVGSSATESLLGLKIRLGQVDAKTDRSFLKMAREAADRLNLRIMVHLTGTDLDIEEVVQYFNKGDILTHPFQGKQGNILNKCGKVRREFIEAIERGILLDVGHGGNHFTWRVFLKCLEEGIKPHTISTDLTRNTWGKSPVYNLNFILSKMLAGGLSMREILEAMLITAPGIMGIDISTLNNLVVLQSDFSTTSFPDVDGEIITGELVYKNSFIISQGNLIKGGDELSLKNI
ncbi:hypothetical protein HPB58_14590 [Priestia filamentosa]|uniref:hypothetical protein n=1 Tax=Priestia filamentosa TaxID=1402861 RepID=UPI001FB1BFE7|nr:hypothetical protein [Priestia filamentosa]MED3728727.1 hypothetical protein [Priestia filamentosa]UOE58565.1 hypothetical protein HPB58_14590 [Priestia filamentosa]